MSQKGQEHKTVDKKSPHEPAKEALSHPIATAVDRLIHRARDIDLAGRLFLPLAFVTRKREYEKTVNILNQKRHLLDDPDKHTQVLAQKEVHEALGRYHRLRQSHMPEVIETGLFLGLFSAFDAFTGDLLKGLYTRKPKLFESLDKSLSVAQVLEASSIEVLKLQALEEDIESIRRKSYMDQFGIIGRRFGVNLTDFDKWSDFVECSQRRNLLTHCDGIVTDQYLLICRKAGSDISKLPAIGSKVELGSKYFYASCELVMEVGVKLGQTLWRKALAEEIEKADKHLQDIQFEALQNKSWSYAKIIGEFAFSQKKTSKDLYRKIFTVNYVLALKRSGAVKEARQILNEIDWSAAAYPFKLARAVLVEDYIEASILMKKIGTQHEWINEIAYHTWPFFIEFRDTDEFASTYLDIFGHPYASKLRETAEETSQEAAEEAQKSSPDDIITDERIS